MPFRVFCPSDGYRLLVSLSACPVPMLACRGSFDAVSRLAGVCGGHVAACLIFTLRLTAVMLVTEARAGDAHQTPSGIPSAERVMRFAIGT